MVHTVCGTEVLEQEWEDTHYGEWHYGVHFICPLCNDFVTEDELKEAGE